MNAVANVKRSAIRGGLVKLGSQGASFVVRLAFTAIVARILLPEDFGIVAMVAVVTAVLEMIATSGFWAASIQRLTLTQNLLSWLFWANMLLGLVLCALCVALAPVVAAFFQEPRLFWVTIVMGAGLLFKAAGMQHLALLHRQMHYVTIASLEFAALLVGLAFGVGLAIAGYGYWALVFSTIATPAILTVSVWIATGWVPSWPHRDADTRGLAHFGGTITLNGVVQYLTYSFDRFILGRVWGATAVGQYTVASQLVNTSTSNINMAVGGVLFSALSRVQDDDERLKGYFLKGYALMTALILPITVFSGAFSEDIIAVVLGPQWTESVSVFRMLVPAVLVLGLINPLTWLLMARGLHVRCLKLSLVIAALVVPACLMGLPYGPTGVAIGFSAAMALWLIPHVVWSLHDTPVTPQELSVEAGRPLLSALVAVGLAFAAQYYVLGELQPILRLAAELTVVAVVYPCMLFFAFGQKDFYLDVLRGLDLKLGLSDASKSSGGEDDYLGADSSAAAGPVELAAASRSTA